MMPEERDLIADLFARLRTADDANKDREAEDFIRAGVAGHPAAPYQLVQTVLVQEHALKGANARIVQLEQELAGTKQTEQPKNSSSFLGRLLQPSAPAPQRSAGRIPDYQPQPTYPPSYQPAPASGGFLQHAMGTAAGVAGGALLFEGIQRLMGHATGPFGSPMIGTAGFGSPWVATPPENTVINNYYDRDESRVRDADYSNDGASDPGVQDADYSSDASDAGGGGDWV